MMEAKNLSTPDDKLSFEHGTVSLVTIGGVTFARAEFNPGWRWSTDVKPRVGTESCQLRHESVVVSGRFHVRMDDGSEIELGPGDAHIVGPGHDAWVVGDEPCVTIDFVGAAPAARVAHCPCGVDFSVTSATDEALDHLVSALQQHASASHGHTISREDVLELVAEG
ncbi:MAG TPA: cupin domain-containing protein [Actinomycetota bacterium]|nr:cupin domain-containing protein [Actinomycetota bacterium]